MFGLAEVHGGCSGLGGSWRSRSVGCDAGYWWGVRGGWIRLTGIGTCAGGVFVVDGLGKEFLVISNSKVLEAVEILGFVFVRDVDQVLDSGIQPTSIS